MSYNPSNYTGSNLYWKDVDTRPKTKVCHACARDVREGLHCVCVPSMPKSAVVTNRRFVALVA